MHHVPLLVDVVDGDHDAVVGLAEHPRLAAHRPALLVVLRHDDYVRGALVLGLLHLQLVVEVGRRRDLPEGGLRGVAHHLLGHLEALVPDGLEAEDAVRVLLVPTVGQ